MNSGKDLVSQTWDLDYGDGISGLSVAPLGRSPEAGIK